MDDIISAAKAVAEYGSVMFFAAYFAFLHFKGNSKLYKVVDSLAEYLKATNTANEKRDKIMEALKEEVDILNRRLIILEESIKR